MNINEVFGERLDGLLFEAKITPEKLAKVTGVELSLIYRYLRKEYLPNTATLIKFAEYFNCPLDYLLGRVDDYPAQKFMPCKNFAEQFDKILKEKHYSRYRLKKETELAKQSVDDWYLGRHLPNAANLIILAKYFDCSIDYLLGRTNG